MSSLCGGWSTTRKRGTFSSVVEEIMNQKSDCLAVLQQLCAAIEQEEPECSIHHDDQDINKGKGKDKDAVPTKKYISQQCRKNVSNFKALDGHVAAHNYKRRMQEGINNEGNCSSDPYQRKFRLKHRRVG